MKTTAVRLSPVAASIAALFLPQSPALAQEPTAVLPPTVVTATRVEQSSFDLPLSIDAVDLGEVREQRLQTNAAEILSRVPGTVVQSRETYAQEQQIIIRGFGARSQFGVRGIKLYADGIPASTPDGQGGSYLFDVASAKRIEVLRGPFSALYGNHSGGVVQIFTEDGPERPTLEGSFAAGSYDTWRAGAKFGGQSGTVNYIGSLSRTGTDGYRQWSGARKDQVNTKLGIQSGPDTRWTIVANYLDQPDNLDPLGLTAAQVAADRRQANPVALTFQTRRNLSNLQGGLVWEQRLSEADSLRAIAYAGKRTNEQYLAIPLFVQAQETHSGGVSAFDRNFGGLGVRFTRRTGTLTLTTGVDYEHAEDARKGFVNNNGVQGDLKRDESNTVYQAGAYGQLEWQLAAKWSLSAGLRYTRVSFESRDRFIVGANPDDSGSAAYSAWTPAVGLLHRLSPTVNIYVNAGRSFEAPTFIELAYRPDNASGLNFDLEASESTHYEAGIKALVGEALSLNAAVFQIDTRDEIVVATNVGGRASYQNAGDTRRRGIELAADASLPAGFSAYVAATWLEAEFEDAFVSGGNGVSAGNRIPAVPNYTLFGQLNWHHAPLGFTAGVEARWSGKVQVNDANTAEAADDYTVVALRAGFEQRLGNWHLRELVRVDNLFDDEYIGAVYVNDGQSRFYAPAPERNYLVSVSAAYRF